MTTERGKESAPTGRLIDRLGEIEAAARAALREEPKERELPPRAYPAYWRPDLSEEALQNLIDEVNAEVDSHPYCWGDRNSWRLDGRKMLEIFQRRRLERTSYKKLAIEYGVSQKLVEHICDRQADKLPKHLKPYVEAIDSLL